MGLLRCQPDHESWPPSPFIPAPLSKTEGPSEKPMIFYPAQGEAEVWGNTALAAACLSPLCSAQSHSGGKCVHFNPNAGGLDFSFRSFSLVAFAVNCVKGLRVRQEHVLK